MSVADERCTAKVCPLMSDSGKEILCIEVRCRFWISVYTSELYPVNGCAHALAPQMVDGMVRS